MKIALCNVGSAVYVPSGEYLNGVVIDAPTWANQGEHSLEQAFAAKQDANGMLEIVSADGHPVVWGSCCTDHS